MRVSQAEMDKNYHRIVKGASRLMRKNGIANTSVNDVMQKAGLTHGGFYRHFPSKDKLVSAALDDAFDDVFRMIEEAQRNLGLKKGTEKYFNEYLSDGHIKHPELGCPIAALSLDVARSALPVKESYSNGFNRTVEKLAQAGGKAEAENRADVIRRLSMLAGAVMIARASNEETALSVLRACKFE